MNLGSIKDECWSIARDTALIDEDRLWPEAEMINFANRVYFEIARQTKCIIDSTTPSVCLISSDPVDYTTYVSGTLDYIWANDPNSYIYQQNVCPYLYQLHSSILEIIEAKWTKNQWKLIKVSSSKWQSNVWWEQIKGMPTEYALDLESGKLALNFRSEQADTIRLHVKRLPLVELLDDGDIPELKEEYHRLMFNGILYYMYSKQDADTVDEAKAANYYNLYLKDIDEIKHRESFYNSKLSPNYAMGAFR